MFQLSRGKISECLFLTITSAIQLGCDAEAEAGDPEALNPLQKASSQVQLPSQATRPTPTQNCVEETGRAPLVGLSAGPQPICDMLLSEANCWAEELLASYDLHCDQDSDCTLLNDDVSCVSQCPGLDVAVPVVGASSYTAALTKIDVHSCKAFVAVGCATLALTCLRAPQRAVCQDHVCNAELINDQY